MKKLKGAKKFLEDLCQHANISVACKNAGISRNTCYRWRNDDEVFRKEMDKALVLGTESVSDLAESKLVQHVQRGEMRAIKYWLDNHKRQYVRPRTKDFLAMFTEDTKPRGFDVIIHHGKSSPTSNRDKHSDGIKI